MALAAGAWVVICRVAVAWSMRSCTCSWPAAPPTRIPKVCDTHIYVCVPTCLPACLCACVQACILVEKLLHPDDDVMAEHKRQQLRELAILNGGS